MMNSYSGWHPLIEVVQTKHVVNSYGSLISVVIGNQPFTINKLEITNSQQIGYNKKMINKFDSWLLIAIVIWSTDWI